MADHKSFPHDDQFPENVNPTEENRRAFSEQVEKDRKEQEAEAKKLAEEEGDSSNPDAVAADGIHHHTFAKDASQRKTGKGQSATVN